MPQCFVLIRSHSFLHPLIQIIVRNLFLLHFVPRTLLNSLGTTWKPRLSIYTIERRYLHPVRLSIIELGTGEKIKGNLVHTLKSSIRLTMVTRMKYMILRLWSRLNLSNPTDWNARMGSIVNFVTNIVTLNPEQPENDLAPKLQQLLLERVKFPFPLHQWKRMVSVLWRLENYKLLKEMPRRPQLSLQMTTILLLTPVKQSIVFIQICFSWPIECVLVIPWRLCLRTIHQSLKMCPARSSLLWCMLASASNVSFTFPS